MMQPRIVAGVLGALLLASGAYAQVSGSHPDAAPTRLAVLDFPIDQVHLYGVGGERQQRSDGRVVRRGVDVDFDLIRNLQDRFRAQIERLLTQGRWFTVLDRSENEIYAREQEILTSGGVSFAERARLGRVLGVDYVLYGTVDRIAVEQQQTEIRISGERREQLLGSAQVRFSVLAVTTREIMWSSLVTVEHASQGDVWPEQLAEAVLAEVAMNIVDEIRPADATQATAEQGDSGSADEPPAAAGDAKRTAAGDEDGDGLPDYLNRSGPTGDEDGDGLPDYLNRDFLRRR